MGRGNALEQVRMRLKRVREPHQEAGRVQEQGVSSEGSRCRGPGIGGAWWGAPLALRGTCPAGKPGRAMASAPVGTQTLPAGATRVSLSAVSWGGRWQRGPAGQLGLVQSQQTAADPAARAPPQPCSLPGWELSPRAPLYTSHCKPSERTPSSGAGGDTPKTNISATWA